MYPALPGESIDSEFYEKPWHAGMGQPGHTCNYCANVARSIKKMTTRVYKPSGFMARNKGQALRRMADLRYARATAARGLSFPSKMSTGGRANIINYQQVHVGGEVKSVDVVEPNGGDSQGSWNLNSTMQVTPLNLITAGSSMWNRIGRKVTLKSVHLQGFIGQTGNSYAAPSYARIMIVYDKQPNGTDPNQADLLQNQVNSASDSNISNVYCGLNLNNRDRFEIISDRRIYLPSNEGSEGISATVDDLALSVYAKLKGRKTHFKADSSPAVIGDIATGSLLLVTMGNVANGDEPYALTASIRLRYTDL